MMLWFLVGAMLPIVIHLINRRRHKTIQWAAMQFLLKATKESRGKKKLRHWLILLCRVLAVALLALAAAKPLVSGLLGWGGGDVETVVLLLDRSPSMEVKPRDGGASKRQLLLEEVKKAMGGLSGAKLVLIDSATQRVQEVPTPEVLEQLLAVQATDAPADIAGMLVKATEYLSEGSGRSEVWIASDMQQTSWRTEGENWSFARSMLEGLPQKPLVRVMGLTGNALSNLAIRVVGQQRQGEELVLDLEMMQTGGGGSRAGVPLTIQLNGASSTETVTMVGQVYRFQKRLTIPAGNESGYGVVTIAADGNPRDNRAYFAYGATKPMKSVLVASPGEVGDYCAIALAPPGYMGMEVERVEVSRAMYAIKPDVAAVVWAAPMPEGAQADAVTQYVKQGGQILFLPPGGGKGGEYQGVKWAGEEESLSGKFFILGDWNHGEGLMKDGLDGSPLAANRMKAIRRQVPEGELAVMAKWADGRAFLARKVMEQGVMWYMATTADYRWSNLGDADVLLPVMQRLVMDGQTRYEGAWAAVMGSRPALEVIKGERMVKDRGEYESNVYRVEDRYVAVNRPWDEDFADVVDRESVERVLSGVKVVMKEEAEVSRDEGEMREFWRVFIGVMIVMLLAEAFLCLPKKEVEREGGKAIVGSH